MTESTPGVTGTGALSRVVIASPVGSLLIEGDDHAVTKVWFTDEQPSPGPVPGLPAPVESAVRQLGEYFGAERQSFDLALAPVGTPFQLRVWAQLQAIPYGQTASYGEVARALALRPGASRAVGLANGANPIAIVIPCHRVIGADGSLTGYAGGIARKQYLLDLEAHAGQQVLFAAAP